MAAEGLNNSGTFSSIDGEHASSDFEDPFTEEQEILWDRLIYTTTEGDEESFIKILDENTDQANENIDQIIEVIKAPDEEGRTFLHAVSERGWEDAVTRLLELSADPNQADKEGRSPLYNALETEQHHIVDLLLINGADIEKVRAKTESDMERSTRIAHLLHERLQHRASTSSALESGSPSRSMR